MGCNSTKLVYTVHPIQIILFSFLAWKRDTNDMLKVRPVVRLPTNFRIIDKIYVRLTRRALLRRVRLLFSIGSLFHVSVLYANIPISLLSRRSLPGAMDML